jgi:hypothetical protein
VYALEDAGLRVAEVADLDALTSHAGGDPDTSPQAVRVSTDDGWAALADPDLVVRPTWVHWASPCEGGTAEILARQSRQQRSRTRKAMRLLESMTMQLCEPVEGPLLREWEQLYTAQLRRLERGRNFFALSRREVLASGHALALWRVDGRLVCGCVMGPRPDWRAFLLRFSAVAEDYRDEELPRGMYALLADLAAKRGMRWITLGNDANFYGALTRPGLCAFKLRIGFRPVPADLFGVTTCRTVVDRVTNLRGLETPVLRFGYQRVRGPDATIADFVDGPDALGLVSVSEPDASSVVLESLPPHRRLVLGR